MALDVEETLEETEQAGSPSRRTPRPASEKTQQAASHRDESPATEKVDARSLYFGLYRDPPEPAVLAASREWLADRLRQAEGVDDGLPGDMDSLLEWVRSNTARTGRLFEDYLRKRREGAPQRYFSCRSHALYFLRGVAPTKLVDGAWLYGLAPQWRDHRYTDLIRTYLEELGDGEADKNHVLIYKNLLMAHGCADWHDLSPGHFVQGALQLSLARHTRAFLPEAIGFNLGYEQLPLHLLISAHELDELGIDPYYFRLHVTIDNAATGHAARAVRAVQEAAPTIGDRAAYYRRVHNGYVLSGQGVGTLDVIAGFNLRRELVAMLARKAPLGTGLHSDRCRIAGQSVNAWLAQPAKAGDFLDALVESGWVQRHQPPEASRFWRLVHGDQAPMFGVFTEYERQLLFDWIAGEALADAARPASRPRALPRGDAPVSTADFPQPGEQSDFSDEGRRLRQRLAALRSSDEAMDYLVKWMSPGHHHTRAGLLATQAYSEGMRRRL